MINQFIIEALFNHGLNPDQVNKIRHIQIKKPVFPINQNEDRKAVRRVLTGAAAGGIPTSLAAGYVGRKGYNVLKNVSVGIGPINIGSLGRMSKAGVKSATSTLKNGRKDWIYRPMGKGLLAGGAIGAAAGYGYHRYKERKQVAEGALVHNARTMFSHEIGNKVKDITPMGKRIRLAFDKVKSPINPKFKLKPHLNKLGHELKKNPGVSAARIAGYGLIGYGAYKGIKSLVRKRDTKVKKHR